MSNKTPKKRIKSGSKTASCLLPSLEANLDVAIGVASAAKTPNLFTFMHTSVGAYCAAFLLCISFFLQGVNYAEAQTQAETTLAETETETEVEQEQEQEPEPEPEPQPEVQIEEEVLALESQVEAVEEEILSEIESNEEFVPAGEVEDVLNNTEEQSENIESLDTLGAPDTTSGSGSSESVPEDEEMEEGPETEVLTSTVAEGSNNNESSEEEVSEELEVASTTASSTEAVELISGNTESVSMVQSDSAYTFNREECTKLATGSYYCLKPVTDMLEDALFAAPDEDGDLEIFLVRGGVQSQVTSNQVDDAAPYYDENSNTIVWHRLYNDRFQIVSYDIESGDEILLTNTPENNMEPTRQGDYTVWQRWENGAWNIIFHNGQSEFRLTNGGGHNVAPYVHGSLIVWNRHNVDGQKTIEMYDIDTESYVSVPDAEGLSVSNPRMVFVFDSLTPEGDIITKGYDVLSRKFIDLDSLPKNLPDEIPNSDSTGETRALIQSKPTLKTDIEELLESDTDIGLGVPEPEPEPMTLNLATSTADVAAASSTLETDSEFELVIEPYNVTTASSSGEQIEQ